MTKGINSFDGSPLDQRELLRRKELRRDKLRTILQEDPIAAYQSPDFENLMREEIDRYIRGTISTLALENANAILEDCPRLKSIYSIELEKKAKKHFNENDIDEVTLKRSLRLAGMDGRALGEIELALFRETRYGLPTEAY